MGLLKPGRYSTRCLTFASADGARSVLQFEYRWLGGEHISAVDMLFVDDLVTIRMADFFRMPDRSWRDNFGARADSLLSLLPVELGEYELVDDVDLGVQIVGEGL
ncbi:hypothetical protein DF134_35570 [Burkholderia stagnalis]|nr:hypothetical protein DF134_35570 [Burkholderia stagnalis]